MRITELMGWKENISSGAHLQWAGAMKLGQLRGLEEGKGGMSRE